MSQQKHTSIVRGSKNCNLTFIAYSKEEKNEENMEKRANMKSD